MIVIVKGLDDMGYKRKGSQPGSLKSLERARNSAW